MATYAGVSYTNGAAPTSILAAVEGQPDAFLRRDAADAWNRGRRDVLVRTGITLVLRGWNRTIAEQERFFFERYEPHTTGTGPFGDVRWYKGVRYYRVRGASAAIPGTSNHGWGLAVDVVDYGGVGGFDYQRRAATFPILARHGWTDTEGRGVIQEPWHLVYDPSRDTNPPIPEDDMTPMEMFQAKFKTGRKVMVNGVEVDEEVRVVDALKAIYFYGDLLHRQIDAEGDRAVAETSSAYHQLVGEIDDVEAAVKAVPPGTVEGTVDLAPLVEAINKLPQDVVETLRAQLSK